MHNYYSSSSIIPFSFIKFESFSNLPQDFSVESVIDLQEDNNKD